MRSFRSRRVLTWACGTTLPEAIEAGQRPSRAASPSHASSMDRCQPSGPIRSGWPVWPNSAVERERKPLRTADLFRAECACKCEKMRLICPNNHLFRPKTGRARPVYATH